MLDSNQYNNIYKKVALEVADLTSNKNIAYGDGISFVENTLLLLFPNGIPVEKYNDVFLIIRLLDKICRISHDKDAYGESPWKDINGYSLLALIKKECQNGNI